jgi:hypothetical protein
MSAAPKIRSNLQPYNPQLLHSVGVASQVPRLFSMAWTFCLLWPVKCQVISNTVAITNRLAIRTTAVTWYEQRQASDLHTFAPVTLT